MISGRQNGGMAASKSMHSLSKMKPDVNCRATLAVAALSGIKTSSERYQSVATLSEAKHQRSNKDCLSHDLKTTCSSRDNATRSNSVI